jgi:protein TonB
LIIVVVLALLALWASRDTWVDALAPPYSSTPAHPWRDQSASTAARGNLAGLFSASDYPIDALRKEEQGTSVARLDIDASGRVTRCSIISTSGSALLDKSTCRVLEKRAQFTPARDSFGRPIEDSYVQRITWRLE